MNSKAVVEELPKIAPLKTRVARDNPLPDDGTAAAATPAANVEEEACVTPRLEANLLKPAMEEAPSPESFFPVPRDLSSVFYPVSYRPKKRIRAG
ncbi:unnamed protein product [Spirodela intermedia]|uniref:Uncharacterized protein n=1 Tax=Spirodela intermedia TaxID=51605 RepID=A0A7I8JLV4_SPIIN|nr:unnamed protein product [Spirodela intermedia]CAA6671124.1 unnamed protein product [Spirodela intermedia]